MDVSNIKEHMPVYADAPGGLEGASEEHIGNVDKVEGGKYIKLTKHSASDGQHHCFRSNGLGQWISEQCT